MFGLIKFLFGGAKVVTKLLLIMGVGTVLLAKPPFIDTDSHFEVVRTKSYVYQVNYSRDKIDSVEIFDKQGNYKGEYEYSELKGIHKKVINGVKK